MAVGQALALEGDAASIGSSGDAYDNALAAPTAALFTTEAIRDDSPFRNGPPKCLKAVVWLTMALVAWYNQHRLFSRLDDARQGDFEATYYTDTATPTPQVLAPAKKAATHRGRSFVTHPNAASLH